MRSLKSPNISLVTEYLTSLFFVRKYDKKIKNGRAITDMRI